MSCLKNTTLCANVMIVLGYANVFATYFAEERLLHLQKHVKNCYYFQITMLVIFYVTNIITVGHTGRILMYSI